MGCYIVAGVGGLYGGYVLTLGVGWRLVSQALTGVTTRSIQREAASLGQRVVELRFRVSDNAQRLSDDAQTEGDGVPEVDRIMKEISVALGKNGDCPEAACTGENYRLFVRATDVQTGVSAVRHVAARQALPSGSYLWIPDLERPRMGKRLNVRGARLEPCSSAEPEGAAADGGTTSRGIAKSPFLGFLQGLRESLSLEIEWMRMPKGHRALSKVHRSTDVVLRYFHEPLDLVDLELLPGPQAEKLLRFAVREVPPVDQHTDVSELKVWLRVQSPAPAADVMLGSRRLGSTHLPPHAWQAMSEEAKRGIFADGHMEASRNHRTGRPVVRRLRCYLPRDKNGEG